MPDEDSATDVAVEEKTSVEETTAVESGDGAAESTEVAEASAETKELDRYEHLTDRERKWLGLEAHNISPETLLSYAAKGWQAEKDQSQGESTEPAGGDSEEGGEFISRTEHEAGLQKAEERSRMMIAQSQNESQLSTLMDGKNLTQDDGLAQRFVKEETYKAMVQGQPLKKAFQDAYGKWEKKMSSYNRKYNERKVAAQKSKGESTSAGEPAAVKIPDMKHSARDFDDGTALNDAMKFMKNRERQFAG